MLKEEIVEVMITIRDGHGTHPNVETSALCEVKDDRV